jgi:CheY-specific phosphatase CheX
MTTSFTFFPNSLFTSCFDKASIQKVSSLFLEENESDDETLKDMILETTNLIVGSAKVIAQESDRSFDIGTPHFQKIDMFDFDFDEIRTFKMGENSFIIAIKEINV